VKGLYQLTAREGKSLHSQVRKVVFNHGYFPNYQMEDKIGSIEVDKFAVLIILDRNLFEIDR
jgi:hypothetical protein